MSNRHKKILIKYSGGWTNYLYSGITSFYSFNSYNGTVIYDNNNLHNSNNVSGSLGVQGKVGKGFIPGSGAIEISGINLANTAFSISTWIYNLNTTGCIAGSGIAAVNNGLHIVKGNDTFLRFGFYGNDLDTYIPSSSFSGWHHYVFVVDSNGNKSVFFDGIKQTSSYAGTATGLFQYNGTFRIGQCYSSNSTSQTTTTATFDDFGIYLRALNSNEILAIYNQGH